MVSYDEFELAPEMSEELKKLRVDFLFQPVFYPDGKRIFAYESFMHPEEGTIKELIDRYNSAGKLHVLEIATFFGAAKVYVERGYTENVCMCSFPSEVFSDFENEVFDRHFGNYADRGIVKILEYPEISIRNWERKSRTLKRKKMEVSLNNFGIGNNDFEALGIFRPKIVKIGRDLIADIHKDSNRQVALLRCIQKFHDLGAQVIASGIESREEMDFLVPNGADYLQGYYLAKPE